MGECPLILTDGAFIVIKRTLINALVAAVFGAGITMSAISYAEPLDYNMPAIKESNTIFPADMKTWLENSTLYSWNPVNVRLGYHPDRPDPNDANPDDGLDPGVIYIFPNGATANAWWDPTVEDNPPTGIPDTAVAYLHWVLDNRSGQFPGIMAIADDFDFKTNNCIMSSGQEIPIDANADGIYNDNVFIPKTCGNPQGSSKRFKLVVLQTDQPIDIVFNMTRKVLDFSNFTVTDFNDDWFRIYRYIMKFGNGTATDAVQADGTAVPRAGDRIVRVSLELGAYNVALGTGFQAAPADLTFEFQECIENKYFDKTSTPKGEPSNDCPEGSSEIWLDYEYATFSPAMYSLTTDKRTEPVGGYWDKYPAGVNPPQSEAATKIDSGVGPYLNTNYPYDPNGSGQIGQTTTNYFDIDSAQAVGAQVPDNMFGYMMHYGVFANADPGNVAMGIYCDDDGEPSTEGRLYAWWDGSNFRWGPDPTMDATSPCSAAGKTPFGILTDAELAAIAARPMSEDHVLAPPRYEFGYMDDLAGLNMDTFIRFDKDYDVEANPQFAVRFVATSASAAGLDPAAPGVPDGPWVASPIPQSEEDFFDDVAVPGSSSDSGGFCSYNRNGRFDPVLPGLILAALAYLGWRLKKKSAK
jgi:hypothetical protein